MTAIRVQGLFHHYAGAARDRPSVDDVSFEVEDGEFYTLLGPSGCGKTTTLRCVAGLEDPSAGLIELDGAAVVRGRVAVPPNKRDIGLVFQDYAVWPHMSVFDNVAYPLRMARRSARLPRAAMRDQVEEALDMVGLGAFASRRATQLSGGQQQRLSLARALVRRPKVLLLDEPLSNLDAKLREQMRTELRSIQRRLKIATLFVTHDQVEALSMSNRIAVMRDGKIVQEGTPREIYQSPSCDFVARFVGVGTFVHGTVLECSPDGERAVISTSMGPLRSSSHRVLAVGEPATVVVRPEDVVLDDLTSTGERLSDGPGGTSTFDGVIEASYFVGDAMDHRVRVGEEVIRARGHGRSELARGARVRVTLPAEACTLLRDEDAVTEGAA